MTTNGNYSYLVSVIIMVCIVSHIILYLYHSYVHSFDTFMAQSVQTFVREMVNIKSYRLNQKTISK